VAERVLPYATAEARKFGARVVLLHVCRKDFASFSVPLSGDFGFIPLDLILKEFSLRWRQAGSYLGAIARRLALEHVDADPVIIEGNGTLAETITTYAEENDIHLIAMATRSRSGLSRLVFGSVTGSVAKRSAVPVLVVKTGNTRASSLSVPAPVGGAGDLEGAAAGPEWQEGLDPSSSAA
jgi:nucleotide-binding universal stress UspA family protein